MNTLEHSARVVARALRWRSFLRAFVEGAVVCGTLGLAIALFVPTWPRWPLLLFLAVAPSGTWLRFRPPSTTDLVWWLDSQLGANEVLLTAWSMRQAETPAVSELTNRAQTLLTDRALPLPRIFETRWLWGLSAATVFLLAALFAPAPRRESTQPGSASVRIADPPELREIERLARTDEPDEASLSDVVERARELREALSRGMQQRDALHELRELQNTLDRAAESQHPDDTASREFEPTGAEAVSSADSASANRIAAASQQLQTLRARLDAAMAEGRSVQPSTSQAGSRVAVRASEARRIELSEARRSTAFDTDPSGANSGESRERANGSAGDAETEGGQSASQTGDGQSGEEGQSASQTGDGQSGGGGTEGAAGPGGGHDDSSGRTDDVDSRTVWLRARPERRTGDSTWSTDLIRTDAEEAGSARGGASTAVGLRSGDEHGIDRQPIPSSYRDQVRAYFGTETNRTTR